MNSENNNIKTFLKGMAAGMAVLLVGAFVFSGLQTAYYKSHSKTIAPDEKIREILSVLDKHYVDDYDVSAMTETMYTGMLFGVGDPYTSYMDKKAFTSFMEQTSGKYAGIGVVVGVDKTDSRLKVVSMFDGAPGAKAGILIEDKIIKVNGINVYGDAQEETVAMIKGPPGTPVTLTIFREHDNRTFDVTIKRENISVPTVSHEVLEDGVGYLRITGFEQVTYDQFMESYQSLRNDGIKGLIIDVRNNPGGVLDIVVKIADELVPQGTIVYTEDKNGRKTYSESDSNCIDIPLAILVNGNSASASEVLSGAVKDLNMGVLVGTQTYGKGLVQRLFKLADGSALKVTVAKYYTPSGVCINGEGLTPDYVVDMDMEKTAKIASLEPEDDEQLQKAVEVIKEKLE